MKKKIAMRKKEMKKLILKKKGTVHRRKSNSKTLQLTKSYLKKEAQKRIKTIS